MTWPDKAWVMDAEAMALLEMTDMQWRNLRASRATADKEAGRPPEQCFAAILPGYSTRAHFRTKQLREIKDKLEGVSQPMGAK